jgi:hypothetical protein
MPKSLKSSCLVSFICFNPLSKSGKFVNFRCQSPFFEGCPYRFPCLPVLFSTIGKSNREIWWQIFSLSLCIFLSLFRDLLEKWTSREQFKVDFRGKVFFLVLFDVATWQPTGKVIQFASQGKMSFSRLTFNWKEMNNVGEPLCDQKLSYFLMS